MLNIVWWFHVRVDFTMQSGVCACLLLFKWNLARVPRSHFARCDTSCALCPFGGPWGDAAVFCVRPLCFATARGLILRMLGRWESGRAR